ncbi:helix-turn-helix transcriptional regulator [Pseudonocardia endophytica]|uniref:AraC-like DNA-binding protein n=1 Tax=Pseudonocardia endophytica TaxID=401976 RepID=A0A4R1HV41_PSEEN|nr:AraC family transcriptional regulator [Pseudonocardia endophytica]TCK26604.1 AraC-like DNA-binding protein [Pseudonocardia endophytica]
MATSAHVERVEIRTTDPERAHETLTSMYAAHTPRLHGSRERFRFRISGAGTDVLRVDELAHSMGLDSRQDAPYDALIAVELLSGQIDFANGRTSMVPAVGGVLLGDPHRPNRVHWSDVVVRTTRLDLAAARRVVEDLTGMPAARVDFELSAPVSASAARYFRAVVERVRRDVLPDDELLAQPLVRSEVFRQLVVAFLSTFPNSASRAQEDRPEPHSLGAEPAVVRRAVGFVESNAHRDIGLGEIAQAARIGPRGLQHAFRKHRGCAPTEYLRQVRMDYAHQELLAADPSHGDTVAAIAARWGFLHAGRFSIGYRSMYGRSPSDTLRH